MLLCHGVEMTTDFTSLFTKEDCDLMQSKGGSYPEISKNFDSSMANVYGFVGSHEPIFHQLEPSSSNAPLLDVEVDDIETTHLNLTCLNPDTIPMTSPLHSLYIVLSADGRTQHKKTILYECFDSIYNIDYKSVTDCLLHVWNFSIGGDS